MKTENETKEITVNEVIARWNSFIDSDRRNAIEAGKEGKKRLAKKYNSFAIKRELEVISLQSTAYCLAQERKKAVEVTV